MVSHFFYLMTWIWFLWFVSKQYFALLRRRARSKGWEEKTRSRWWRRRGWWGGWLRANEQLCYQPFPLLLFFTNSAVPSTFLPLHDCPITQAKAKLPVGARLYRTGGAVHMEPTSWMKAFWIAGLLSIPQVHCQSPARLCFQTSGDFGDCYLVLGLCF